jgi:hypothetical protein
VKGRAHPGLNSFSDLKFQIPDPAFISILLSRSVSLKVSDNL